jgi:methyl-accepting chemotaxis protein
MESMTEASVGASDRASGWTVRRRLYAGYATVLLLFTVAVGLAVIKIDTLQTARRQENQHVVPYLTGLQQAALTAKAAANDERGFLLTGEKSFASEVQGRMVKMDGQLDAARAAAETDDQRTRVDGISTAAQAWLAAIELEFTQFATDRSGAVEAALGANRDLRKAYEKQTDDAVAAATASLTASVQAGDRLAARVRIQLLIALGVGLLLGLVAAGLTVRGIQRALARLRAVLEAVARGDLTQRAPKGPPDELGAMATAVNRSVDSIRLAVTAMADSATTLASASEQLSMTSTEIATSADETAGQATMVSSAAEQVSSSIATVAAGAEEVGASIREIAQNTADAVRVARGAVEVAQATNVTMNKLGESSAEISSVVKVITSISEQTNLLALNATIEAARAGEAGKGFAVVASEVKDLAQGTAKATEDIGNRIEAIQNEISGAVSALEQITSVIGQINDYQVTISSAVEEQTATTSEMSRSVSEAATGSSDIAKNITGVAASAQTTTKGVSSVQVSASDLARMSNDLRHLVGQFNYN